MQGVNVVDVLLTLVHLTLDPMSIEVTEQVIVVLRSGSISLPFSNIVLKELFPRILLRVFANLVKMLIQVFLQPVVQAFPQ
jgi:hypothetical protein